MFEEFLRQRERERRFPRSRTETRAGFRLVHETRHRHNKLPLIADRNHDAALFVPDEFAGGANVRHNNREPCGSSFNNHQRPSFAVRGKQKCVRIPVVARDILLPAEKLHPVRNAARLCERLKMRTLRPIPDNPELTLSLRARNFRKRPYLQGDIFYRHKPPDREKNERPPPTRQSAPR